MDLCTVCDGSSGTGMPQLQRIVGLEIDNCSSDGEFINVWTSLTNFCGLMTSK